MEIEAKRFENTDWSSLYAAIGKFVVDFERVVNALRFNHQVLLQVDGLHHWEIGENILLQHRLSPEDLAIAFCATARVLSKTKETLVATDEIVKEIKFLSERRNEVVHGDWLIGADVVVIGDGMPERNGIRRKPTKEGAKVAQMPTEQEISEFAARCDALRTQVKVLTTPIMIAVLQAKDSR